MQCTGSHQAMQVQMLVEVLPRGVQRARGVDRAAEPAWVGAEFDERCGYRGKQDAVDLDGVALGKRVQLVREREHQVKVRHRQQLSAPGCEPAFLNESLALWAMAIAAGVGGQAVGPPGHTLGNV